MLIGQYCVIVHGLRCSHILLKLSESLIQETGIYIHKTLVNKKSSRMAVMFAYKTVHGNGHFMLFPSESSHWFLNFFT